ncbi:MAG: ABC transporter permease [Spirochaetales bacterium]|nr:ABC transporter permease [Spirochaetales bacterium]
MTEIKKHPFTQIYSNIKKFKALPVMGVYLILITVFIILSPKVFTRPFIYMSFLQTIPPQLVLALGLTLIITAGEIDLSFSAVIAFSGFLFSFIYKNFGENDFAALMGIVAALGGGAFVGYINGLLVARLKVPSIMATLAAQFFWNGLTVLLCGGLSLNIKSIRGTFFHSLFVGRLFDLIPVQAFWAIGLTVFLWFILNRHRFGEALMFIGDNPEVARVMGVNIENTKIKLFTLQGLLAGFAALLLTLEMINFWSNQGSGYLLPVMAAVFIGGTSIAGGEGIMVGTFFGAFIIGSLEAGVVATGIGGYWVRLTTGLVMAGSIILNNVLKNEKISFKDFFRKSVFTKGLNKGK